MKKFREYYSINEQDIMGMINTAQSLMGGQSGTETDSVKVPEVDATQFQTTDKQKEVSGIANSLGLGSTLEFISNNYITSIIGGLTVLGFFSKMVKGIGKFFLEGGKIALNLNGEGVKTLSKGVWGAVKFLGKGSFKVSKNIANSNILKTFTTFAGNSIKTASKSPKGVFALVTATTTFSVSILTYFLWNSDMVEIAEQWKTKKHYKDKNDTISKNIYTLITKGLFQARDIGTGVVERINSMLGMGDGQYCIVRPEDSELAKNIEGYDKSISDVEYCLLEGDFVKTILATTNTETDWINDIKINYHNLPISGKSNLDDYGTIKNFVTKWDLESSNNYYGKTLSEGATGIIDTNIGLSTPGMNALGWATFFTSEDYLNNINSLNLLKDRKMLMYVIKSYWVTKVNNLDASNFSVNQFCKLVEVLSDGKKSVYTDPNFVSNLMYAEFKEGVGSDGSLGLVKKIGNFQSLLTMLGKNITNEFKKIAKTEDTGAITNATISFALLWATSQLLYYIQNCTYSTLGQLAYLVWVKRGIETDYGKIKGGVKNIPTSTSTQKSSGGQSQPKTDKIETPKTIEEVIDKVDNIPGIEEFEG